MSAKDLTGKALDTIDYFSKKLVEQGFDELSALDMAQSILMSAIQSRRMKAQEKRRNPYGLGQYPGMTWNYPENPYSLQPTHYYDPQTSPRVGLDGGIQWGNSNKPSDTQCAVEGASVG